VISPTALDGVLCISRPTVSDERGFVGEPFRLHELEDAVGHPVRFVQHTHSRTRRGALRGLHAEDWDKLVYVPRGVMFQVVADIRPESSTFGQVAVFELGEHNRVSLYLPRGVANGCCPLSDEADYVYLVTQYYDGSDTRAVRWDDPDLAVPWPIDNPVLSERDQRNPSLRELLPGMFQERSRGGAARPPGVA
jgi:dTDP-4-dehydrorhamnose 3,5-epimerase